MHCVTINVLLYMQLTKDKTQETRDSQNKTGSNIKGNIGKHLTTQYKKTLDDRNQLTWNQI